MTIMRKYRLLVILVISLFCGGCGSLFFYPEKGLREMPAPVKEAAEDISFKTADGLTLHGWYFRTKERRLGTILFLHGNAENISTHVYSVLWLVKEGFDVFAFDYRGYGKSEGKATLEGVHRDAEAALEKILALPQSDKNNIIVFGQSIGGAIATYTVANSSHKDKVKALVIDSAFSSYRRIAREKLGSFFLTWPFQYPASVFFDDRYSPERWIARVSPVPVLIMHGDSDGIVPVDHGSTIYEKASEPRELWLARGRGHIGAMVDEGIRAQLVNYLKAHTSHEKNR